MNRLNNYLRRSKIIHLWGRPPVCRFEEPLAPWSPTNSGEFSPL